MRENRNMTPIESHPTKGINQRPMHALSWPVPYQRKGQEGEINTLVAKASISPPERVEGSVAWEV